ncbi:MarR family transcriptional regulator [Alphaproteobacteria bacterium]|nr:MarR family transcriptional regulator [Alphaproteobacteria bacterium]
MQKTKQSLSELWSLLRNKEEKFGLLNLSLTERDILQSIIYFQGEDKYISLEDILSKCSHPRATFFRCLKKLRTNNIVKVTKDNEDARKSYIKVYPKFTH